MPTVIIPPTDVSPYTGTGSQVLATNPTFPSNITVNGTTDSSSKDTGAIVTEGGLGVEKSATIGGNLTVSGTGTSSVAGNLTVSGTTGITGSDLTLGTSGPSVKSTLSARAPRQGLVFDGTGAASISMSALGTKWTANFWVKWESNTQWSIMYGGGQFLGIRVGGTPFCAVELTSVTVPIGKWTMLTMVGDGTNTTPFINGVAGTAVADGANYGAPTTVGAAPAGSCLAQPLIYNRALSAAEVVALYEAGAPSGADYPTQVAGTSLVTGDNSTFASDTGFWQLGGSSWIGSGKAVIPSASYIGNGTLFKAGYRYRVSVNVIGISGTVALGDSVTALASWTTTGVKTVEVTATGTYFNFGTAAGNTAEIDDVTVVPLGLLLAPDNQQVGGGLVWADTSGNAANITLPGSGVSWNVPSQIGEYVDAELTFSNRTALTDSTAKNVTSITLTAGDWDVTGVIGYYAISATALNFYSGTNTTSATFGADGSYVQRYTVLTGVTTGMKDAVPVNRIAITSTTTVYLVARADFSSGTIEAWGTIRARRVR